MTIIYFIIILGVTLTIHELGHFIFAKKSGIYCYEFSIGMGPKLYQWTRKNDETIYSIRLLPIGGYVSMAGEEIERDKEIPLDKQMQTKPWHQRFLTIIAGVLFNFIFALILLFIVALISGAPTNIPAIGTVEKGYSAHEVGLKQGDVIVSLNGKKISTTDQFMLEIQVLSGKDITLTVDRKGKEVDLTMNPKKVVESGNTSYRYGFTLDGGVEHGIVPAISYAFAKMGALINQMFMIIGYLFTGKIGVSSLAGPIGIFNVVGESAKAGILNLVYLTAYLSINVGFINLLPIPAFDGGRALFLIIEKIRRKPISPKIENRIHAVGFILLMGLMLFVTYHDIIRIFK